MQQKEIKTLLENNNFRNNQNYLFWRKKTTKNHWESWFVYPIYKTEFLEFLNSKYKNYQINNRLLLFIFKILNYIRFNNLDLNKIKWLFWQIDNVFILKPTVNTFKKIWESFTDINLDEETGISNKEIIFQNFFDNEEKNINTDNYIFRIKYNYTLNPKTFSNYIWKRYLEKKYNIFTNKTNYFEAISNILVLIFLLLIFLGIFWFLSIWKLKIIIPFLFFGFLFLILKYKIIK